MFYTELYDTALADHALDFYERKEHVVIRTNIHPKSGRHHQKVDVPSLATHYTVV